MKKFLKFLLIIIMLPVIIVSGVITYLKFADLNPYKPEIEKLLQKYAKMDIKIVGDLDVGISLKPSLEVNDVSIFKPDNGDKMAQIGKALIQISILPLMNKEVVIDVVEMNNMTIYQKNSDEIKINSVELTMDDYDSPINVAFFTDIYGINIDGILKASSLKQIQKDNYNKTDIKTIIHALGYTLNFDGNIDGLQNNIKAAGKYTLQRGKNNINGDIAVDTDNILPYVKMNLNSEQIDVVELTATKKADNGIFIKNVQAVQNSKIEIPYEYFKMFDADIDFDVKKIIVQPDLILKNVSGTAENKNGTLKINVKNINYDGNDISGQIKLESENVLPYVKLNITGSGFDLTKYKTTQKAQNNFNLVGNAYASQLMENIDIPYQYLKMANVNVSLSLKTFVLTSDIKLQDIKITAALLNGNLNSDIKNITAGDGVIKGTIALNANNKTLSTDLSGDGILLQKLYTPYSDSNNPQMYVKSGGKTNFLLKLNTSGNNTDQYLSNANGQIIAFMDKSVLKIKSFERLQGNLIVQILNAVKISDITKKDTDLSCAVVRADIKDGLANFPKGIAINATDFYLVANGTLNLKNDKLNFDLQPFSGKLDSTNISSIIGSLLKIKGTINNPKININQTTAAKNVVGFLASGGAYNVGDMLLSADSAPCHTALEKTAYANYFKAGNPVTGGVSKGYNSVKDGISNVGDNIKATGKEIKNQVKGLGNQIKGLFKK